jgi:hypothetical protein
VTGPSPLVLAGNRQVLCAGDDFSPPAYSLQATDRPTPRSAAVMNAGFAGRLPASCWIGRFGVEEHAPLGARGPICFSGKAGMRKGTSWSISVAPGPRPGDVRFRPGRRARARKGPRSDRECVPTGAPR